MQVVVEPFNASKLFASIRWDKKRQLWDSAAYREHIERSATDHQTSAIQALRKESISSTSSLFKASVHRVTAEHSRKFEGQVDLAIDWTSRDQTKQMQIRYEAVANLHCSGINEFLVGGDLLGHELTQSVAGWRHALLFIENDYLLVECREIGFMELSLGEA